VADLAGESQVAVPITSSPFSTPSAGDTWYFQFWYRDANPVPTSNFSGAERVVFQ
jgi:hypothetical protein